MSKIYRWQAQSRIGGGAPVNGHLHIDFDAAMMAALTYGTWVAWSTERVDDETQPVLQECDGDGPTVGDWGWTEIPTDDPRVLAFFDCPDVDEIERQIVQRLTGYQYGLREDVAWEALEQVEQYDGYRVQSIATSDALRAIPSESRPETSRSNGRRGGRPVLMTLTDDLGRCVGCCEAPGSRAGEIVEYGSRILARTSPDGYVEPQTFRVEGRATLACTRPADRDDIRYHSRAWDIQ